jgi:hypothetical protein
LLNMKMDKIFAKNIITSGEAATKIFSIYLLLQTFCSSLS